MPQEAIASDQTDLGVAHAAHRTKERLLDRISLAGVGLIVATLAIIPPLVAGSYSIARLSAAVLYLIIALGFNIAFGLAGELALGYCAVMAVSAYTAGMLNVYANVPGIVIFAASLTTGTAFGVLLMLPSLRVRGWYFGLVSMFAVLAMPSIVLMAEDWTGGENGLIGVRRLEIFGFNFSDTAVYILAVLFFGGLWLVVRNLKNSTWGLKMMVVRDAYYAAQASGIDPMRVRLTVFVLTAIPAALAGFLQAFTERFVNPATYNINFTLLILTGVVLGGAGTLWGPVIGVGLLAGFSLWVGPFSSVNAIAFGLALLVGVTIVPNGFASSAGKAARRLLSARRVAAPPAPIVPALSATRAAKPLGAAAGPVLEIRSLKIAFGTNIAVKDVDLALPPASFCGLVGPNGSGKSTVLNAICGAVQVASGSISINGANTTRARMFEIGNMGVGRTFQMPQLIGEATVLENIMIGTLGHLRGGLGAAILGLPSEHRRYRTLEERALFAFHRAGLDPSLIGATVADLPLGLKRIVEVARAIASDPHIVLLDEPAAGLNRTEKRKLGETLRRLNAEGVTVVLVEHNVSFVLEYCREIALLDDGRISARWRQGEEFPASLRNYIDLYPVADEGEAE